MNQTPQMRPKAIIFDWDNTLVDSWPVIHDALNHTFRAFGLVEWTVAETHARVRKSMRDSFPGLFGDEWERAGEVFYTRYDQIHADRISPTPGAEALLHALCERKVYQAVVSNKKGHYLRKEAENLGWTGFFSELVGALDAEQDKPSTAPVEMALRGAGISPGPEVWFVGDADIDLECATAAGCVPILVRGTAPASGEFSTHPPTHHFLDCEMLCKYLNTL